VYCFSLEVEVRRRVFASVIAIVVVLAVGLSIVYWYGFIRLAPADTSGGTIISKTFVPQHSEEEKNVTPGRRGRVVTTEKIVPDEYAFEITIDGVSHVARTSLSLTASSRFEEGQQVEIKYRERGIWPFKTHISVLRMEPRLSGSP
jgi:hypothetical protein